MIHFQIEINSSVYISNDFSEDDIVSENNKVSISLEPGSESDGDQINLALFGVCEWSMNRDEATRLNSILEQMLGGKEEITVKL